VKNFFVLFLLFSILLIYCKENVEIPASLIKNKIDAFYLSNDWVGECVYINERQVFFIGAGPNFILFDTVARQYITIEFPDGKNLISINGIFFDYIRNAICLIVSKYSDFFNNEVDDYFYLFHINDFSWEAVPELTNKINPYYHHYYYYYDVENSILYFISDNEKGEITSFDMNRKIILSKKSIPNFNFSSGSIIYNIGGDPVKILLSYEKDNSNHHSYCIYDYYIGNITSYFSLIASDRGGAGLFNFIYLDNGKYLCIDITNKNNQKIILLDLFNNEQINDIYDQLNNEIRDIYDLRKTFDGKYSFLAVSINKKSFLSTFRL